MADQVNKEDFSARDLYKESTPCWKILLRWALSHGGLCIIIIGIGVLATYGFIAIEQPAETEFKLQRQGKAKDLKQVKDYLIDLFWHYKTRNVSKDFWRTKIGNELNIYEGLVIGLVDKFGYDGTIDLGPSEWNWPNTGLFVFSLLTTIGYGQITPNTYFGKLFTILVTIITIPIFLLFLTQIGDTMANMVVYTYSRLCCRCCRARRKMSEISGKLGLKKWSRLEDEHVGHEDYMPTSQVQVPITLTLLMMTVYVLLGAVLFTSTENWDYTSSAYFVWITLSSTGLGDYVPGNTFDDEQNLKSLFSIIITIIYCTVGLALVSTSIKLMQVQMSEKFRWLAKEIGINGDNSDPYISVQEYRRRAKAKPAAYEVPIVRVPETSEDVNEIDYFKRRSTAPEEPSVQSEEAKTLNLMADPAPHFELPGTPIIQPKSKH